MSTERLQKVARLSTGADGPCQFCGQNYPTWRAPNDLWNLVTGGPDATDDPGGMLCPNCFLRQADEHAPVRGAWVIGTPVRPESVVAAEALTEAAEWAERASLWAISTGGLRDRADRIAREQAR